MSNQVCLGCVWIRSCKLSQNSTRPRSMHVRIMLFFLSNEFTPPGIQTIVSQMNKWFMNGALFGVFASLLCEMPFQVVARLAGSHHSGHFQYYLFREAFLQPSFNSPLTHLGQSICTLLYTVHCSYYDLITSLCVEWFSSRKWKLKVGKKFLSCFLQKPQFLVWWYLMYDRYPINMCKIKHFKWNNICL